MARRTPNRIARWVLCGTLLTGCSKPLTAEECSQLLDRYVTLLAISDRPETSGEERNHMRQQAREMSKRDPSFGKCGKQVPRRKFDCAMKAPNTDLFEQCLM
jgi:hypothetical protein